MAPRYLSYKSNLVLLGLIAMALLNPKTLVNCQDADEEKHELTPSEKRIKDIQSISNIYGGLRGYITGFKQGFYKQGNIEISPQCFGQDYLVLGYNAYQIVNDVETMWYKLYELPLKGYAFFEMIDQDCNSEELLYDMWYYCASHNCTMQAILENEKSHIFQITATLNAVASIIYGHYTLDENENLHNFYFDMYQDVGVNIGRMARVSIEY